MSITEILVIALIDRADYARRIREGAGRIAVLKRQKRGEATPALQFFERNIRISSERSLRRAARNR